MGTAGAGGSLSDIFGTSGSPFVGASSTATSTAGVSSTAAPSSRVSPTGDASTGTSCTLASGTTASSRAGASWTGSFGTGVSWTGDFRAGASSTGGVRAGASSSSGGPWRTSSGVGGFRTSATAAASGSIGFRDTDWRSSGSVSSLLALSWGGGSRFGIFWLGVPRVVDSSGNGGSPGSACLDIQGKRVCLLFQHFLRPLPFFPGSTITSVIGALLDGVLMVGLGKLKAPNASPSLKCQV